MSTITHQFVSSKPDGPDTGLVRPGNWNDVHSVTNQINIVTGTTTLVLTNDLVRLQAGDYTVTVPLASGTGKPICVCQDGAGFILLEPSESDTIGGLPFISLDAIGDGGFLIDEAVGIWGWIPNNTKGNQGNQGNQGC